MHPEYHLGDNVYYVYNQSAANGFWCAGNTEYSKDKPTVKTIYDPSPAGYTIPRYNAFLGFRLGTSGSSPNVNGSFAKGYYFWNVYRADSGVSTTGMRTIFFPASGSRNNTRGALDNVTSLGYYWSAVPDNTYNGRHLRFYSGYVYPQSYDYRSRGCAVRPSQE